MGTSSGLVLAMVVITGTLIFNDFQVSAQCGGTVPELVNQCARFVMVDGPRKQPSSDCCKAVQHVSVPCVCGLVTPRIEQMISMVKAVYVARACGLNVDPGMKCGSYTVQPKCC